MDLGSDQTSCHNPFNGGYYPVQLSFSEAQSLMSSNPAAFKHLVQERWATGKSSRSRRVLTSLSLSFLPSEGITGTVFMGVMGQTKLMFVKSLGQLICSCWVHTGIPTLPYLAPWTPEFRGPLQDKGS